ncbi:MAG: ATP-dependent DNA helicase RecG, partial [Vicingaceae bacterium]|nr:ATP-dependent DNA helicase RecG [Vicingaceae bacterium]
MSNHFLDTKIEFLKGVGPKRAEMLRKELGISTYGQLLLHYPFRYIDKSKVLKISDINSDEIHIQLRGKVVELRTLGEKRGKRLVATLKDDTGEIELVWFKGIKWLASSIIVGKEYVVYGKPTEYNHRYNIAHPDIDLLDKALIANQVTLEAVYHTTEVLTRMSLNAKGIHKIQKNLVAQLPNKIQETLPVWILDELKLVPKEKAIINVHAPENEFLLQKSRYRLKFEELFYLQLNMLRQKGIKKEVIKGAAFNRVGEYFNKFYNDKLPFELTDAQKRVLKEIRDDVGYGNHMNRLLQGDVGSGKTIVALMSILIAIDNGYQACLMAPTEILANQHFEGITELIEGIGLNVQLLTGSVKTKKRREIHEQLENGELHILIGTHALIEDKVKFDKLGFVVIDEQHRFGVQQRSKLWRKGTLGPNGKLIPPHVLVMTATPIPRTLAMTFYGDLDVSVIDELPPGRKEIKTIHRFDNSRMKIFGFMEDEIKKGRQVYVVYPLIKESEKLDYKDLMEGYNQIEREFPLPKYQV